MRPQLGRRPWNWERSHSEKHSTSQGIVCGAEEGWLSLSKDQSQPESCTVSSEEQRKGGARMNRNPSCRQRRRNQGLRGLVPFGLGVSWYFVGYSDHLMGCFVFQSLGKSLQTPTFASPSIRKLSGAEWGFHSDGTPFRASYTT